MTQFRLPPARKIQIYLTILAKLATLIATLITAAFYLVRFGLLWQSDPDAINYLIINLLNALQSLH